MHPVVAARQWGLTPEEVAAEYELTQSQVEEALDRLLSKTQADEWMGQARWINEWQ